MLYHAVAQHVDAVSSLCGPLVVHVCVPQESLIKKKRDKEREREMEREREREREIWLTALISSFPAQALEDFFIWATETCPLNLFFYFVCPIIN